MSLKTELNISDARARELIGQINDIVMFKGVMENESSCWVYLAEINPLCATQEEAIFAGYAYGRLLRKLEIDGKIVLTDDPDYKKENV